MFRSSGGFWDSVARYRNSLRGPCLKVFVNQAYSSSFFSLNLLCLKGVFKCFPVMFLQFFIGCKAPSGLPKVWGLGPWPPGPLKTATASERILPDRSSIHSKPLSHISFTFLLCGNSLREQQVICLLFGILNRRGARWVMAPPLLC